MVESKNLFISNIFLFDRESTTRMVFIYGLFNKKNTHLSMCVFFTLYSPHQFTSNGGKQSPPLSGQQLNPWSPISVYVSPGQHPY